MIDTLLFDFDGTIMDTNDLIISSWKYVYKEFGEEECPISDITSHFGEPIMNMINKLFPDRDPEYVVETYRKYHNEKFNYETGLFPGVMGMLREFTLRRYPMAIVTNRIRRSTEMGLKNCGIMPMFGSIVCEGEAPRPKPFPDSVFVALDQLKSSPDRAILVGDSQNDIICGKNAGILTVRVEWAVATDEKYDDIAAKPDYTIEEPNDLVKLLDEINKDEDRGWEQN